MITPLRFGFPLHKPDSPVNALDCDAQKEQCKKAANSARLSAVPFLEELFPNLQGLPRADTARQFCALEKHNHVFQEKK
jgi:hypothetical protein